MRFFLLVGFLVFSCSASFASDKDEMLAVLSENFRACNDEDIEGLMATCSVDMPDREGFREESETLFREKDVRYSLIEFEVTEVSGGYAEARVVQATHTEDRTSDSPRREFVRHGTTLLPRHECVEYMVAFKREGGKWKCLATISEPVPYDKPARRAGPARRRLAPN